MTVNNSNFTSNTASSYGGAIYNNDGTLTVTDSTFTSNNADHMVVLSTIMVDCDCNNSTFTSNSATNVWWCYLQLMIL